MTLMAPLSPAARKRIDLAHIRYDLTAAGRRLAKVRKAKRERLAREERERAEEATR